MTDYTSHNFGHPLHNLAEGVSAMWQARRRRRKLKSLLDLDDHMLKDVGVTRGEVEIATGLPLYRDATSELYRMASARRRSMM